METVQSTPPSPSNPAQSTPPPSGDENLKRNKLLVALFLVIFAGAVAYFLSSSDMFRGAFLTGQEKETFKQAMTTLSKTDGADYEITAKDKTIVGEQTRNLEISAKGKVNFSGAEGAQHVIQFTGTGTTTDPASPENTLLLSATLDKDEEGFVNITWGDIKTDESSDYKYKFYKSATESDLSDAGNIATILLNQTFNATAQKKYTDILTSSGTYFYRMLKVSTTDPTQVLKKSPVVSVTYSTLPPPAAENFTITSAVADDTGINLAWIDLLPGTLAKYEIYRINITVPQPDLVNATPIGATQKNAYKDTGVQNGNTYSYIVKKIGVSGIALAQADSAHVVFTGKTIKITKAAQNAAGGVYAEWTDDTDAPSDENWSYYLGINLENTGWNYDDAEKNFSKNFNHQLQVGKTYTVKIKKAAPGDTTVYGESAEVNVTIVEPGAVKVITITKAAQNAAGGVDMEWTDDADTPSDENWMYYPGLKDTDGTWNEAGTGKGLSTTFEKTFETGKTYTFRVKKASPEGILYAESAEVNVAIPVPKPLTLTVKEKNDDSVTLEMKDETSPEGVETYVLYRTLASETEKQQITTFSKDLVKNGAVYNDGLYGENTTYIALGLKADGTPVVSSNSITIKADGSVAFRPTKKSFASLLMAQTLPAGEPSAYQETISGGGTLTETKDGLQGTLVLKDSYKVSDKEFHPTITLNVKNGKVESVAGDVGDALIKNQPALQFVTQDFLEKNYEQYFKINQFLANYSKALEGMKDGIQKAGGNSGLADTTSANDSEYNSTVDAFTAKMAPYPAAEADRKITFLTNSSKAVTQIEGVLKYSEASQFSFLVSNLHVAVSQPAGGGTPSGGGSGTPPSGGGGVPLIFFGNGGGGPTTAEILALQKAKEDAEKAKAGQGVQGPQDFPFSDVNPQTYGYDAIVRLAKNGLIEGYREKGKILFKPGKSVNRAEMSKMILGSICVEPSDVAKKPPQIYADVQPGTWFFQYTKQAYIKGYFTGYKGERDAAGREIKLFRPSNTITQAEVIKPLIEILRREGFLNLKAVKMESPWFAPYMRVAKDLTRYWEDKESEPAVAALVNEGEADPMKPMTRGEAAVFVDRMISIYGSCRE